MRALVAIERSILTAIWHMLTTGSYYQDLGGDYYTRRNTDRQRDRLVKQLTGLGYYVTLDKIA